MTATQVTGDGDDVILEAADDALAEIEAAENAARRRRRRRLVLAAVVLTFVVTRAIAGYVTDHPDLYGANRPDATSDVLLYNRYTWDMRHEALVPYRDFAMEYPPGAISLMAGPRYLRMVSYRIEFIVQMVLVDALGLLALWLLARRTGCWWGVALWLVLVPALGPVVYARLDLAVAVALLWAVERAHAGRWGWTGVLLGIGAAIKLVPVLLLPAVLLVAPRGKRLRVAAGTLGMVAVSLVPFALMLPDVYHSVLGYHLDRGVHVESIWGAGLFVAHHAASYPMTVVSAFGAYDIRSGVSGTLKFVANLVAAGVALLGMLAAMRSGRGDIRRLSMLLLATMTLCVAFGRVFSPQYVAWLIGLAAAAVTLAPRAARVPVSLLSATVAVTHLGFPYLFWDLVLDDTDMSVAVLVTRDLLTVAVGVSAAFAWWRMRPAPIRPGANVVQERGL